MDWMETDYSKHTHFRWEIKWRLEHLGALGMMDEMALAPRHNLIFFVHRDGVHVNSKTCSGVEIGQEVRKTDYMCECFG